MVTFNLGIWTFTKRALSFFVRNGKELWHWFFPLPSVLPPPHDDPQPPEPPVEYVEIDVCQKSGFLPHVVCSIKEKRKFIKGTEPTTECQTCRADVYWPVKIGYGEYGALDPKKNYKIFFRILYNYGVNLVRVFGMSPWQNYYPYKKLENGKYDVTQLNPAYFSHLKDFITEARRYGEIVMLDLFDRCGISKKGTERWYLHAFNSRNNINGFIAGDSGVPEFYSDKYWPYHKAYIDKVLDTLKNADNMIYEMVNEPQEAGKNFDKKVFDYIKGKVKTCTSGETKGTDFWSPHGSNLSKMQDTRSIMIYSDDGAAVNRSEIPAIITRLKQYNQGFEFIACPTQPGQIDMMLLEVIRKNK